MNDLQDRLDSSFGHGPAHQPLDLALSAGRRAVRRRRMAAAGAAFAVLAVAGGTGIALAGGHPSASRPDLQPATQSTVSPSPEPWPASLPELQVSSSGSGQLSVHYGRIGQSIGPVFRSNGQEAYGYEVFDSLGTRMFVLTRGQQVQLDRAVDGQTLSEWLKRQGWSADEPMSPDPQPTGPTSPLVRSVGSRFEAKPGVRIIAQRSDLGLPANFSPDSASTIGALVERSGTRYYVLYREIAGAGEFVTVPASAYADTLSAFLDQARAAYRSGEGLL